MKVRDVNFELVELCELELPCSSPVDFWEVLWDVEDSWEALCPEIKLVEAPCAVEV